MKVCQWDCETKERRVLGELSFKFGVDYRAGNGKRAGCTGPRAVWA